MNSFLAKADQYQTKPKLFINNSESIPSKLGFALTIITMLSSIVMLIYSLAGVLSRSNYINSFNQEFKKFYALDLSDKPIFFSILNRTDHKLVNYEEILELSASHISLDPSDKNNQGPILTKIKLEKCTKNENTLKNLNYFPEYVHFHMENFMCLVLPEGESSEIMGEKGNINGFSFLKIDFTKCANNSISAENKNKKNCLSENLINEKLKDLTVIWGSLDYDISHESLLEPFQPKVFTETLEFSQNLLTQVHINSKLVEYNSDDGFFLK